MFNSQNTHAAYRLQSNLDYVFGPNFKLSDELKF